MSSLRVKRVQELILQIISELIIKKIKDPRLEFVSLTGVKVSPDLKKATITYSLYNDSTSKEEVQESLKKASGFFRRELSLNMKTKYIPALFFQFDRNLEYAHHINQLLGSLNLDEDEKEESEEINGDN